MNTLAETKSEAVSSAETEEAYVLDAPYTWSYFEYQNPKQLAYVAQLNGIKAPSLNAPFRYCDLGCGNGVTNLLLADAYPHAEFHGVDFNPEHIENAKRYAEAGVLKNCHFVDAAFEDYADYNPPMFDFIVMHGIYSWVSAEVRGQILSLVDQFLAPGGLLYVSYNAFPGWTDLMPLWKMMHAFTSDAEGDSVKRAQIGLQKIKSLRDSGARYFRDNPSASTYLDRMLRRDPFYVAHEFCNGIFEPHYVSDVASDFASVGLEYAGTAKIHRNRLQDIISPRFSDHLNEARDKVDQQFRASLIRNEFFRRDIYVRDPELLSTTEIDEGFKGTAIGAVVPDHKVKSRFSLSRRSVVLESSDEREMLRRARTGHFTPTELAEMPDLKQLGPSAVSSTMRDLIAGSQFQTLRQPVLDSRFAVDDRFVMPSAINRTMLNRRLLVEGKTYLSSDILGSALRIEKVAGLYALYLHETDILTAESLVQQGLEKMDLSKRRMFGVPSEGVTPAWLQKQKEKFLDETLPILVRYGILKVSA